MWFFTPDHSSPTTKSGGGINENAQNNWTKSLAKSRLTEKWHFWHTRHTKPTFFAWKNTYLPTFVCMYLGTSLWLEIVGFYEESLLVWCFYIWVVWSFTHKNYWMTCGPFLKFHSNIYFTPGPYKICTYSIDWMSSFRCWYYCYQGAPPQSWASFHIYLLDVASVLQQSYRL